MSRATDAAEAVKNLLNADPVVNFGQEFVAVRRYVPNLDLDSVGEELSVQVVARSDRGTALDRVGVTLHDLTVDIGIQKRLTPGTNPQSENANPEIDDLADLAERIADFFKPGTDVVADGATVVETAIDPIYAPEHLTTHSVFTSIVRLGLKFV